MCATNIWTVNSAAYTDAFRRFTSLRLGVEPQDTDFRITSGHVRALARTFTLTSAMCDCGALVGLRNGSLADNEVGVEAWLGWMRDLPAHVPHATRLAVLLPGVRRRRL